MKFGLRKMSNNVQVVKYDHENVYTCSFARESSHTIQHRQFQADSFGDLKTETHQTGGEGGRTDGCEKLLVLAV